MGFKGSVELDFGKLVAAFAACQNWNACHDFYNHAMGLIGVWIRNKLNDEQYILQLCQSHFQRNQRELLCSVRRGRGFAHCHVSATTATRHQTGRRAFLMNFIVLHTDKDETFWMNLILSKVLFIFLSMKQCSVCFAFSCASMAYQFGFQQSCFCESLHIHTHDTHTHAHIYIAEYEFGV